MAQSDTETIARRAFSDIAAQFPHLEMVEESHDEVEVAIAIPVQRGLDHDIWLTLQDTDELHFGIREFHVGWFPCTDTDQVRHYIDAVTGFLSGRYRLLEHYRGRKCIKAELQEPVDGDWETVATWSAFLCFALKRTYRVIQNR